MQAGGQIFRGVSAGVFSDIVQFSFPRCEINFTLSAIFLLLRPVSPKGAFEAVLETWRPRNPLDLTWMCMKETYLCRFVAE
jgi:hypothetical protein